MRVLCESQYTYSLLLLVKNLCNSGDVFLSILPWWKEQTYILVEKASAVVLCAFCPRFVFPILCNPDKQSLVCNNRGLFFGTLLQIQRAKLFREKRTKRVDKNSEEMTNWNNCHPNGQPLNHTSLDEEGKFDRQRDIRSSTQLNSNRQLPHSKAIGLRQHPSVVWNWKYYFNNFTDFTSEIRKFQLKCHPSDIIIIQFQSQFQRQLYFNFSTKFHQRNFEQCHTGDIISLQCRFMAKFRRKCPPEDI